MRSSQSSPSVVVVSENPETVDGLQAYFVSVGIASHSTRALEGTDNLPKKTTAVVVFPDGFGTEAVVSRVQALHRKWPRLLLLLITADPRRFVATLSNSRRNSPLIILPKPALGWTIVDALRVHAEGLASASAPRPTATTAARPG